MGEMRRRMAGRAGATLEPIWRLYQDKFLKKAYCYGKLRNGTATRGAYGTREESWKTQAHVCRLQDWSKRRELLAEEEVTGQNPWMGKADGFRAQMQEPGFARLGLAYKDRAKLMVGQQQRGYLCRQTDSRMSYENSSQTTHAWRLFTSKLTSWEWLMMSM